MNLHRVEATIDRFRRGVSPRYTNVTRQVWAIPLDVVRGGDNVIAQASLPGVRPEDISVTIDDNVLTISGSTATEVEQKDAIDEEETAQESKTYLLRERRTGAFQRSIRLPDSVDAEKAETVYEAGVLTITLPKLEAKKAKQLTVAVKGGETVTVE
jgi:HSP20 family protein